VSFAAVTLCVASQQVFVSTVVYFVIDSVRKLLDTPSYTHTIYIYTHTHTHTHLYTIHFPTFTVYTFCLPSDHPSPIVDLNEFSLNNDIRGMNPFFPN
jgi:hypothetical protein